MSLEQFKQDIQTGYTMKKGSFTLGALMKDGEVYSDCPINIPFKTLNRHGLVAGSTGSGKTKTLQILAEHFSKNGIPSLLMDIKGDMSGIAIASDGHPKIDERHEKLGFPFTPSLSPVEFLTLSNEPGSPIRATLLELGPILFSKMLELNETQTSIVAVIFKYCDDHKLPLIDLKDFKEVVKFMNEQDKDNVEKEYGRLSSSSLSIIQRKIMELEGQGAESFFAEPSFDPDDLCKLTQEGLGMVSILRLIDIQNRPKFFATFMLSLLDEIYLKFPEQGDSNKPKLMIFIDEAHLLFKNASSSLVDKIETIVKLIRSKGVGIIFCTQTPVDIPQPVLSQLGFKIQHALRAFTAKDRKDIKLISQNYPETDYYDVEEGLTQLGIGEAFVTLLNEKGIPTPLAHCMLRAPESRMGILTEEEIKAVLAKSVLLPKYEKTIDPRSAHEILLERIEKSEKLEDDEEVVKDVKKKEKDSPSFFSALLGSTVFRQIARTLTREVTRGIMGSLGLHKKTTRRKRRY